MMKTGQKILFCRGVLVWAQTELQLHEFRRAWHPKTLSDEGAETAATSAKEVYTVVKARNTESREKSISPTN